MKEVSVELLVALSLLSLCISVHGGIIGNRSEETTEEMPINVAWKADVEDTLDTLKEVLVTFEKKWDEVPLGNDTNIIKKGSTATKTLTQTDRDVVPPSPSAGNVKNEFARERNPITEDPAKRRQGEKLFGCPHAWPHHDTYPVSEPLCNADSDCETDELCCQLFSSNYCFKALDATPSPGECRSIEFNFLSALHCLVDDPGCKHDSECSEPTWKCCQGPCSYKECFPSTVSPSAADLAKEQERRTMKSGGSEITNGQVESNSRTITKDPLQRPVDMASTLAVRLTTLKNPSELTTTRSSNEIPSTSAQPPRQQHPEENKLQEQEREAAQRRVQEQRAQEQQRQQRNEQRQQEQQRQQQEQQKQQEQREQREQQEQNRQQQPPTQQQVQRQQEQQKQQQEQQMQQQNEQRQQEQRELREQEQARQQQPPRQQQQQRQQQNEQREQQEVNRQQQRPRQQRGQRLQQNEQREQQEQNRQQQQPPREQQEPRSSRQPQGERQQQEQQQSDINTHDNFFQQNTLNFDQLLQWQSQGLQQPARQPGNLPPAALLPSFQGFQQRPIFAGSEINRPLRGEPQNPNILPINPREGLPSASEIRNNFVGLDPFKADESDLNANMQEDVNANFDEDILSFFNFRWGF